MPFSGATYTPPAGAENAAPGQVLQSAVWDAIFTDISAALTTLMTQAINTPTWGNILSANGGFSIWQRGAGGSASFAINASTTAYTADRWYITTGANQASTVAQVTGLDVGVSAGHAAKITRNSGQTGTTLMTFGYPLDTDEINRVRGMKISMSMLAKAGANWSPTSGTLNVDVYFGTGAVVKRGAGFTNETHVLSLTANIAVSGTATLSGTSAAVVPTNATQGEVQITWTPTGTAGGDDSITVDTAIISGGTIVQNYVDLPFDVMLAQCKRHYHKTFPYAVAPAQSGGLTGALATISASTTQVYAIWEYGFQMRAVPSLVSYNPSAANANWRDVTGGVDLAAVIDSNAPSADRSMIFSAAAAAGAHLIYVHMTADAGI